MIFIKKGVYKFVVVTASITAMFGVFSRAHAHSLIKTHLDPSLRTYSYPHSLHAQDYYFYPQGCVSPLSLLNSSQQDLCIRLLAINGIEGIFFVPKGGITIVKQNKVPWTLLETKIRSVFH